MAPIGAAVGVKAAFAKDFTEMDFTEMDFTATSVSAGSTPMRLTPTALATRTIRTPTLTALATGIATAGSRSSRDQKPPRSPGAAAYFDSQRFAQSIASFAQIERAECRARLLLKCNMSASFGLISKQLCRTHVGSAAIRFDA
jgi:hypothetical protein